MTLYVENKALPKHKQQKPLVICSRSPTKQLVQGHVSLAFSRTNQISTD